MERRRPEGLDVSEVDSLRAGIGRLIQPFALSRGQNEVATPEVS